jgi:hypothetical protein
MGLPAYDVGDVRPPRPVRKLVDERWKKLFKFAVVGMKMANSERLMYPRYKKVQR